MTLQKAIGNNPKKGTRARSVVDKEQKRKNLLTCALELFRNKGYQGTSIEAITETAGVSTGTFYLYFKNKVEVYRILNVNGAAILQELIEDAISWPGMTPLSQLSAVAGAYLRFYTDYPGYYDILSVLNIGQNEFYENEEMLEPLNQQTVNILKTVESILIKGIQMGELAETDTWKTTNALWGMLDGILLLDVKKNIALTGKPIQEVFKQGLEIVFHGLTKKSED